MRWTRLTAASLMLAGAMASAQAADIGQPFPSVEAFLKTFTKGEAALTEGYGDLAGAGRRDWAGEVLFDDQGEHSRQIVVLTQNADGSYQVAAQSGVESTFGGTGHHELDSVTVQNGSVFTEWSWSWHGCAGTATQQIKFYKGQWRVIGAEFKQSNSVETADGYDVGDSATLSHNLITGAAIIHFTPRMGKPRDVKRQHAPEVILLDDQFEEGAGGIEEFSKYAGC